MREMQYITESMLRSKIRDVRDFPSKGIIFKDISGLLACPEAFKDATYYMAASTEAPDFYVALDARGFLFASAMSQLITGGNKGGVIMCRKKGKLPGDCVSQSYSLEYGQGELEMQKDIAKEGDTVIIVDDVLATGGSALCACQLCEKLGLKVQQVTVLMEIEELGGRDVLERKGYNVHSLLKY